MSAEISGDIPNWTSLIVEIGVAIFAIGISIFFYKRESKGHKKSQTIMTEQQDTMKEMKLIINEQKKELDSRKNYLNQEIDKILNDLKLNLGIIEGEKRYKSSNDDGAQVAFNDIEIDLKSLKFLINNIDLNIQEKGDLISLHKDVDTFFIINHLKPNESVLPSKSNLIKKINTFQEKYINNNSII